MKKTKTVISVIVFAFAAAQAETLNPVTSSAKDQQVYGNGELVWAGQKTARVGFDTVTRLGSAYIAVFKLPDLPSGETIQSASLAVTMTAPQSVHGGEPDWNIDVYGVRAANTETVLASDFFDGADDANATKVIDNFISIQGAVPATAGSCDSGRSETFGVWLQKLYMDGVPNQKYAFVRLNPDVAFGDYKKDGKYQMGSKYVQFGTGDHETAKPVLTIITASK